MTEKTDKITVRVTPEVRKKIDKIIELKSEGGKNFTTTNLVMEALDGYFLENLTFEKINFNKEYSEEDFKLEKLRKYLYKDNDYYEADDVYKLSVEHKELSKSTDNVLSLENFEKSKTRKIHKLISDFLFHLALQKKIEEQEAILNDKKALIERLEKNIK